MARRYETVYIFDSALEEPAVTEKLERFHTFLTRDGKGSVTAAQYQKTERNQYKRVEDGWWNIWERDQDDAIIDSQGVIRWAWERSREEPLPNYDLVIAEAKKVAAAA